MAKNIEMPMELGSETVNTVRFYEVRSDKSVKTALSLTKAMLEQLGVKDPKDLVITIEARKGKELLIDGKPVKEEEKPAEEPVKEPAAA